MKIKILIFLALLGFFALFFYYASAKDIVVIRDQKFSIEIADSPLERKTGLSGRDGLCSNCAMLFIFDSPGTYPFWMKDMRFDIDMVWMLHGKVVWIAENVSHLDQQIKNPMTEADQVLEFPAGTVDKIGIEIGDEVKVQID